MDRRDRSVFGSPIARLPDALSGCGDASPFRKRRLTPCRVELTDRVPLGGSTSRQRRPSSSPTAHRRRRSVRVSTLDGSTITTGRSTLTALPPEDADEMVEALSDDRLHESIGDRPANGDEQ